MLNLENLLRKWMFSFYIGRDLTDTEVPSYCKPGVEMYNIKIV